MCDVEGDVATCAGRNTHGRSQEELKKLYRDWEETPNHMNTLDVRSLLQVRRFRLLGVAPICTTIGTLGDLGHSLSWEPAPKNPLPFSPINRDF